MEFTTNIDLTSYVDGVRHTHNPTGRATPSIVWEFFKVVVIVVVVGLNFSSIFSGRIFCPSSQPTNLFQNCLAVKFYSTGVL